MRVDPLSQRTQTRAASGLLYTDGGSGELKLRRYQLRVTDGPDRGKEHLLEEGTLLCGTHPDNDFVLTDPTVSRYHLELRVLTQGVQARDNGSRNGTTAREGNRSYPGKDFVRLM